MPNKRDEISSFVIYKNNEVIGEIKVKSKLVAAVIVNYVKAKRKNVDDVYVSAGYLDSKKVNHSVIYPLDVNLQPGDNIIVRVK